MEGGKGGVLYPWTMVRPTVDSYSRTDYEMATAPLELWGWKLAMGKVDGGGNNGMGKMDSGGTFTVARLGKEEMGEVGRGGGKSNVDEIRKRGM